MRKGTYLDTEYFYKGLDLSFLCDTREKVLMQPQRKYFSLCTFQAVLMQRRTKQLKYETRINKKTS